MKISEFESDQIRFLFCNSGILKLCWKNFKVINTPNILRNIILEILLNLLNSKLVRNYFFNRQPFEGLTKQLDQKNDLMELEPREPIMIKKENLSNQKQEINKEKEKLAKLKKKIFVLTEQTKEEEKKIGKELNENDILNERNLINETEFLILQKEEIIKQKEMTKKDFKEREELKKQKDNIKQQKEDIKRQREQNIAQRTVLRKKAYIQENEAFIKKLEGIVNQKESLLKQKEELIKLEESGEEVEKREEIVQQMEEIVKQKEQIIKKDFFVNPKVKKNKDYELKITTLCTFLLFLARLMSIDTIKQEMDYQILERLYHEIKEMKKDTETKYKIFNKVEEGLKNAEKKRMKGKN